eukprot:PLAT3277.4.p1 GENE.PLAT3277.4~~PLAT3277.4.p1  ORF type:complete len:1810 (-),score=542.44 PLAT3277.4:48-5162(-)
MDDFGRADAGNSSRLCCLPSEETLLSSSRRAVSVHGWLLVDGWPRGRSSHLYCLVWRDSLLLGFRSSELCSEYLAGRVGTASVVLSVDMEQFIAARWHELSCRILLVGPRGQLVFVPSEKQALRWRSVVSRGVAKRNAAVQQVLPDSCLSEEVGDVDVGAAGDVLCGLLDSIVEGKLGGTASRLLQRLRTVSAAHLHPRTLQAVALEPVDSLQLPATLAWLGLSARERIEGDILLQGQLYKLGWGGSWRWRAYHCVLCASGLLLGFLSELDAVSYFSPAPPCQPQIVLDLDGMLSVERAKRGETAVISLMAAHRSIVLAADDAASADGWHAALSKQVQARVKELHGCLDDAALLVSPLQAGRPPLARRSQAVLLGLPASRLGWQGIQCGEAAATIKQLRSRRVFQSADAVCLQPSAWLPVRPRSEVDWMELAEAHQPVVVNLNASVPQLSLLPTGKRQLSAVRAVGWLQVRDCLQRSWTWRLTCLWRSSLLLFFHDWQGMTDFWSGSSDNRLIRGSLNLEEVVSIRTGRDGPGGATVAVVLRLAGGRLVTVRAGSEQAADEWMALLQPAIDARCAAARALCETASPSMTEEDCLAAVAAHRLRSSEAAADVLRRLSGLCEKAGASDALCASGDVAASVLNHADAVELPDGELTGAGAEAEAGVLQSGWLMCASPSALAGRPTLCFCLLVASEKSGQLVLLRFSEVEEASSWLSERAAMPAGCDRLFIRAADVSLASAADGGPAIRVKSGDEGRPLLLASQADLTPWMQALQAGRPAGERPAAGEGEAGSAGEGPLTGWVQLRGGGLRRGWFKRFFVLDGQRLLVYGDQESYSIHRKIGLTRSAPRGRAPRRELTVQVDMSVAVSQRSGLPAAALELLSATGGVVLLFCPAADAFVAWLARLSSLTTVREAPVDSGADVGEAAEEGKAPDLPALPSIAAGDSRGSAASTAASPIASSASRSPLRREERPPAGVLYAAWLHRQPRGHGTLWKRYYSVLWQAGAGESVQLMLFLNEYHASQFWRAPSARSSITGPKAALSLAGASVRSQQLRDSPGPCFCVTGEAGAADGAWILAADDSDSCSQWLRLLRKHCRSREVTAAAAAAVLQVERRVTALPVPVADKRLPDTVTLYGWMQLGESVGDDDDLLPPAAMQRAFFTLWRDVLLYWFEDELRCEAFWRGERSSDTALGCIDLEGLLAVDADSQGRLLWLHLADGSARALAPQRPAELRSWLAKLRHITATRLAALAPVLGIRDGAVSEEGRTLLAAATARKLGDSAVDDSLLAVAADVLLPTSDTQVKEQVAVLEDRPPLQGWAHKLGSSKRAKWKRRFFTLHPQQHVLYYHRDDLAAHAQPEQPASGHVDLAIVTDLRREAGNRVRLVTAGGDWVLKPEPPLSVATWLTVLEEARAAKLAAVAAAATAAAGVADTAALPMESESGAEEAGAAAVSGFAESPSKAAVDDDGRDKDVHEDGKVEDTAAAESREEREHVRVEMQQEPEDATELTSLFRAAAMAVVRDCRSGRNRSKLEDFAFFTDATFAERHGKRAPSRLPTEDAVYELLLHAAQLLPQLRSQATVVTVAYLSRIVYLSDLPVFTDNWQPLLHGCMLLAVRLVAQQPADEFFRTSWRQLYPHTAADVLEQLPTRLTALLEGKLSMTAAGYTKAFSILRFLCEEASLPWPACVPSRPSPHVLLHGKATRWWERLRGRR